MPPDVKRSERGAASRSFVIAVAVAVVGVAGYGAWSLLRPDPYTLSERIVRDARREVTSEVRDFQRDVDTLLRDTKHAKKEVAANIDKHLAAALHGIDDVVDGARDRLADLDIDIRTQRNRMDRIEGRAEEAREMVKELADEAKQKAPGS
jgi:signal transduction histidine kinase